MAGIAIFVVAIVAASQRSLLSDQLHAGLDSAAMAAALLLTVLAGLAWRASGRTAPLWLATAALAMTLYLAGLSHLEILASDQTSASTGMAWLAPAGRAVAIAGLVCAALWRPVDSRLNGAAMVAASGVAVILAAFVLQLTPTVEALFVGQGDGGVAVAPLPGALPAIWGGLAGLLVVQTYRRHDPILAWVALLTLTLSVGEALRQLVGTPQALMAADLARTAGLLVVTAGVATVVAGLATGQRRELGATVEASKAAEGRLRAEHEAQAELRHEARSALASVHGATSLLHAQQSKLDPDDRAELADAVRSEVQRLQLLLDGVGDDDPAVPTIVSLAHAVSEGAAGARLRDQRVRLAIDSDLTVLAHEPALVQVVTALLDNAHKHAPGSPIDLRASCQLNGVVLRCEDRGPGVPADERERVFARNHRGSNAKGEGSGLGLAVADRLVHEQGGAMWVDERSGGGASFAVWLPRPAVERDPTDVADGVAPGRPHDPTPTPTAAFSPTPALTPSPTAPKPSPLSILRRAVAVPHANRTIW